MPWKTFIYGLSLLFILVSCGREVPIIPLEGPVALLVTPPDVLTLSNPSTRLNLNNLGTSQSSWALTVHQDKGNAINEWFTLSSRSGVLNAGQDINITLSLKDNLPASIYRATLVFTNQKKSQYYQVIGFIDTGTFQLRGENTDVLTSAKPLSIPITINPEGGFDDDITLSLAGLPKGMQGTFTPNPATTQSTLELSTDGNTAPGDYTLAILGNSQQMFASTVLPVLVASSNTESGFSLALEKPTLELAANQTLSTGLFIRRSNGFATPVTLSAENVPPGLTLTLDPNPVTSQTPLTVQAASNLAKGNYTLTLKGLADTLESSTTLHLRVTVNQSATLSGTIITDNARVSTLSLAVNTATPVPQKAQFASGQLLVKYKEVPTGDLSSQVENRQHLSLTMTQDYGVRILKTGLAGQHDLVETTQDVLALAKQLEQDPRIEYAEPNYLLEALELPNDPRLSEQWFLPVAGLPVAWSVETGNTHPVTVAVIDTGYDLNHPELKPRFLPGYDFCKESEVVQVENEDGQLESKRICNGAVDTNPTHGNPGNFHGTHVAGLIAALGNNNTGIAGAAFGKEIKLLPIKIFDDNGGAATVDTFVNAIRWAVGLEVEGVPLNPNPARIINLSLGGLFESDVLQEVVNEAHQRGALVLAATGNDGLGTLRIPASCNNVLGVGSIEMNYERSSFSNYSAETLYGPGVVDVMTPGGSSNGGLLSTFPGGYGQLHGTSMATPVAAGIAALILSQSPGLSVAELEKKLLAATYFDTSFMNTTEYGKGILRADLALGLPGPESTITLVLSGPSIRILKTTLEVSGQTKSFSLESLERGDYKLDIIANGKSAQLAKTIPFQLTENQTKTLEITLP